MQPYPDYAQEAMENIFHDVENAEVYIDTIGAFLQSWDDHMALLHTILTKLQDNGFTVNSLTGRNVSAGRKVVLFGRYIHDLYMGIVQ